ncbi:MAG: hypothetical protein KAS72_13860 [Phycisphaerales bacterium]|nr:hypothetical protein [Phycisphaerales bacterium]
MTLRTHLSSQRLTLTGIALFTLATASPVAADEPCFEVLPAFPNDTSGTMEYTVNDITSDGDVIVGTAHTYTGGHIDYGFRWTRESGLLRLSLSMPDEDGAYTTAAISDDGWTIFGHVNFDFGSGSQATIWTIDEGQRPLFDDQPESYRYIYDCSADGTVAVGRSSQDGAFVWSTEGGYAPLETAGSPFVSTVRADVVSSDGRIVAGWGWHTSGNWLAFRWTAETGIEELVDWASHDVTRSYAYGMSADGEVVVGYCRHIEDGYRGYRWSEEDGLELIEGWEGGWAHFYDVSDDGVILVGKHNNGAAVWDRRHGTRSLLSVLEEQCGVDLSDWFLEAADVVSADGTTIAGVARNDDWEYAIYIARIERPTCPGDLDGDLDTDQQDLAILLAAYDTGSADGDLDGDGDTDQSDLGIILTDYGCDL